MRALDGTMSGVLSAVFLASLSLLAPAGALAPGESEAGAASTMFALGPQDADRVLRKALASEFHDQPLERLSVPHPGYGVTMRYAIHAYRIGVHRIPATGRLPDGSLVDGYRFEARTSGALPDVGRQRAARLSRNLLREARLVAPGWPVATEHPATARDLLGTRDVPQWIALAMLTLGLALGMVVGSRLATLERPSRPFARRPAQADAAWVSSELLEMTHDAVIVWEMDGAGIVYWNHAAEQLYGFDREQAQGRVTHELLKTRLAGSVSELETRLARYGVWVGELTHTTRDGRQVAVEGRLALLSQRNGRWLVLEVNRDLTDDTRAAEARSAIEVRMGRLRRPAAQAER